MGATFGKVVTLGGHASDLALDERRQVLYLANLSARRIEVVSFEGERREPIYVAAQPSSLALSPDSRFLAIGHLPLTSSVPSESTLPLLTILDLDGRTETKIPLAAAPLAVAFGAGSRAFVVTQQALLLVDPLSGAVEDLTPAGLTSLPLPVAAPSFPPQITQAGTAVTPSGEVVYVLAQTNRKVPGSGPDDEGTPIQAILRFEPLTGALATVGITSSPLLGPRVISTDSTGDLFFAGWTLLTRSFVQLAQVPYPTGTFQTGSHAIDDRLGIVYGQIPRSEQEPPTLSLFDLDNLTLRERIQLPEGLAGRSILSRDRRTLYSISDSGLMILPVADLPFARRLASRQEDVVFRSNFCRRDILSQAIDVVDLGGNRTPFTVTGAPAGVTVTALSDATPARVRIDVDPAVYRSRRGTTEAFLEIASPDAVNIPERIRLLINSQEPEQRGDIRNIPGRLVDILADPARDRLYILRQDRNLVLVYNASRMEEIARLRTANTPVQMAISRDRRLLIVGADNSQIATTYDLERLEPARPIVFPPGHYPRAFAVSNTAILATVRSASGPPKVDRIDLASGFATELPELGIFKNEISADSFLAASPSGWYVYLVEPGGRLMLYDASVDTFTAARSNPAALAGGVAALDDGRLAVGSRVFNQSLVRVGELPGDGTAVGFAIASGRGLRLAAASGPGVVSRFDLTSFQPISPVQTVESPTGDTPRLAAPPGQRGQMILPFARNLVWLPAQNRIIALSASGLSILPGDFDVVPPPPSIDSITNLADGSGAIAPGSLVSLRGENLARTTLGTGRSPLPTFLGEVCVTVGTAFMPLSLVSPGEIRGQLPFGALGSVALVARTPWGTSEAVRPNVPAGAPAVFRTARAGPMTGLPNVYRRFNEDLVTDSNPIHPNDEIFILLTGGGVTTPRVGDGFAAPGDPLAVAASPEVAISGVRLNDVVSFLVPGEIGVYQVSGVVPVTVPEGYDLPLTVSFGAVSTTIPVRVLK
jgi:uncharacterized protein (TIGR03437 family)